MFEDFVLWSNEALAPVVAADLALAYECIREKKGFAVAFAKNGRIVADVTAENAALACDAADAAMVQYYRSRGWIRPWQNIAAALSFDPTASLGRLARAGVDQIVSRERPREEMWVKKRWLGPTMMGGCVGDYRYHPRHALLWPKQ